MILPSAPAYERARRLWNAGIDRRPAAIAPCASPEDAIAALEFARGEGLPVAVRGGGHSVAGHSMVEGGVVIDLGMLRGVNVVGETLHVGGGALWSDVIAQASPFGLATPGAYDVRVGVAGLTLAGGYGMLTRLSGMACDHLVGADVVTAAGQLLRAEDDDDLLWALRGAGANFGVATTLRFAAVRLPPILVGIFVYPLERLSTVFLQYLEVLSELGDETTAFLGIFPAHVVITAFHLGDAEQGARLIKGFKRHGLVHSVIARRSYAELHGADDETFPEDHHHEWRARFVTDLRDPPALAEAARRAAALGVYTCIEHLGGAMGRVAADATAFPYRAARFGVVSACKWRPPETGDAAIAAAAEVEALVAPKSLGIYANYMSAGREDPAAAYGENLPRLRRLKRRFDPENVFRANVNITPEP